MAEDCFCLGQVDDSTGRSSDEVCPLLKAWLVDLPFQWPQLHRRRKGVHTLLQGFRENRTNNLVLTSIYYEEEMDGTETIAVLFRQSHRSTGRGKLPS